jgi:hypothetical protein
MPGPLRTALNITIDTIEAHMLASAEISNCPSERDEHVTKCLREVKMKKLTETATAWSATTHLMGSRHYPEKNDHFLHSGSSVLVKPGKFVKLINRCPSHSPIMPKKDMNPHGLRLDQGRWRRQS